jgi:glyoxylase-like metal-dependent hydrolase (beta-lactamase superfamily II)
MAAAQSPRRVTKLADGVFAIEHRDAQDGLVSGNTTVIIGDRQVFVVDAGFLPSDAREDIDQIRKWTNKPVSFLLNTHWHNDHNNGNRTYMDAFPAVTVIAHVETKRDMDLAGPGSAGRIEKPIPQIQAIIERGTTTDGRALTDSEKTFVRDALSRRTQAVADLHAARFQSATLTFDHDFTIDLGNREVEVKFLGRGNTPGDAVVYLPQEHVVIAGDLIVHPIPYLYDGYPRDWAKTLSRLAMLDAATIVPGHGQILRDKTYLYLVRDLLTSAVTQLDEALRKAGVPAMARGAEDVLASIDLSAFRQRFAGDDKARAAEFDAAAASLIKVAFREASSR